MRYFDIHNVYTLYTSTWNFGSELSSTERQVKIKSHKDMNERDFPAAYYFLRVIYMCRNVNRTEYGKYILEYCTRIP